MCTHLKEGASPTYKHFDGYHPIFTYIGREGYMINTELREGKPPAQDENLPEVNIIFQVTL